VGEPWVKPTLERYGRLWVDSVKFAESSIGPASREDGPNLEARSNFVFHLAEKVFGELMEIDFLELRSKSRVDTDKGIRVTVTPRLPYVPVNRVKSLLRGETDL